MTKADKQHKNRDYSHLKEWQFKPGQSGNPAGRPPTKTLKEYARAYLAGMNEEERKEFLTGLDKKTVWEMAEGKAPQTIDSTVEVTLPKPLLDHVHNNDSNQEAAEAEE